MCLAALDGFFFTVKNQQEPGRKGSLQKRYQDLIRNRRLRSVDRFISPVSCEFTLRLTACELPHCSLVQLCLPARKPLRRL